MAQTLIVALLVLACSLRAAWILAPKALRRRAARAMLAWPLPSRVASALRKHAADEGAGCACDGCDANAAPGAAAPARPAAGQTVPITFHRRLPR
jgi:hypothetical protein